MAALMALPRILLGYVSADALARFALAFRWMSIAIVVHQFVNTVFFRQLFLPEESHARDRRLAALCLAVGALTALVSVALSMGFLHWLPRPAADDSDLLWVMAIAIVLWSTTASLEGWLYGVGKANAQAASVLVGIGCLLAAAFFALHASDRAMGLAIAWVCGLLATIACQMYWLAQTGARLYKLRSTVGLAAILFGCIAAMGGNG